MNHEANESELWKMWFVEAERSHHLRRLKTIDQEKSLTKRQYADEEGKNRHLLLHLKNKHIDTERRLKLDQNKLNYQNQILRKRLIKATINGVIPPTAPSHSLSKVQKRKHRISSQLVMRQQLMNRKHGSQSMNSVRQQQIIKIEEENLKLYKKLTTIKSDIISEIQSHRTIIDGLKDKLQRKSPKKIKILRNLLKRRKRQMKSDGLGNVFKQDIQSQLEDYNES